MGSRIFLLLCCSIPLTASFTWADKLTTADGRTFEGHIVSRTDNEVVFEAVRMGAKIQLKFSPKEVASIAEGSSAPPTTAATTPGKQIENLKSIRPQDVTGYTIIPLRGTFGAEIDEAVFSKSLQMARLVGIRHIVLMIDSPGGSVETAKRIAGMMMQSRKEFIFHAWPIREAISASIWVVFAADHVYVAPRAAIGAAVAFAKDTTGNALVDGKLNSAIAAEIASIAEERGHPAALVRPMMLAGAEAYAWAGADGKWTVANAKPKDADMEYVTLANGKAVMTLTAAEAVKIGFAKPAANLGELRESIGQPGWMMLSAHPEYLRTAYVAQLRAAEVAFKRIVQWGAPPAVPLDMVKFREDLLKAATEAMGNQPNLLLVGSNGMNLASVQQIIASQKQTAPAKIRERFLMGKRGAGWNEEQRRYYLAAEQEAQDIATAWLETFKVESQSISRPPQ